MENFEKPDERLYPELHDVGLRPPDLRDSGNHLSSSQMTESQLNLLIDKAKQKDRIRYMIDKQNDLKLKLKHYEKIKNKWSVFRRVLEGIGIFSVASLGVASIILTAGIVTVPLVPAILAGGSIGITTLLTALDKSLLMKREKSIRKKHADIKETLDKLYFHFEKCREDNIISLQEIEQFNKIVQTETAKLNLEKDTSDVFLDQLIKTMTVNQKESLQKFLQQRR